MRSFVLIGLIGALFASTPIAQAHNTRSSWTAAKAETLVAYDATVPPLSAAERASLLPELNRTVRLYGALRLAAYDLAAYSGRGLGGGAHVREAAGALRPRAQPCTGRSSDRRRL